MAKYKDDYTNEEGVWRTIGGRRVFIRTGQSLGDAMRESGKFKNLKEKNTEDKNVQSVKDFRKKLRGLENYHEELDIGNDTIIKTGDRYAIKKKGEEDDPYRDYDPYVYGVREKWLIDKYKNQGLLSDEIQVEKSVPKKTIYDARGKTQETQETKINRAVRDLQNREKEIERETGSKNPFVNDEYIKEYRNFDKKLNKIKSLDDNERYYYTSSGGGFRNKFRNTWGEKGEKDISVSARMYTNDEFMEHLEDANWHSERSMLEKAGLTNKQMSYIKDQVYVSAWGVDNLDLKRTEQLIKEAKIKYPKEIKPTKYSVTSASISKYNNMFNEYKKLHPNTKMDLQKFARMMMDLG